MDEKSSGHLVVTFLLGGGGQNLKWPLEHVDVTANAVSANDSASPAQPSLVLTRQFLEGNPQLHAVLRLLRDELAAPGAVHTPLVRALTESFLHYVARARGALAMGASPLDKRIERAVELMRRDPRRRWTVEALAKAVGLSRPAFARLFRRHLDRSPHRYLTAYRMELAARLLVESDAGLAEVASQVGYDSEFAFNRAFKRHHHVSPGVFRRQPRATFGITLSAAA
jgi:AraC-like DNA-binding protein